VNPSRATITVSGLRLRTFIGFNPEEREKRQDVVLDIAITHWMNPGVLRDDVEQALNYRSITKAVIVHVEDNRFLLLEKLAADVLNICTSHESVSHARVKVDKPHALRFADSVAITLDYEAEHKTSLRENVA